MMDAVQKKSSLWSNSLIYTQTMGLFVLAWWLISVLIANPVLIPTPFSVIRALFDLLISGELLVHMAVSLKRLAIGYFIAILLGVPLGMLMGLNKVVSDIVDPVIEILRPISGIAWIPIGLFLFGVGDTLSIFIIAYGAFFPVVINSYGGVKTVDTALLQSAKTMGVSPWRAFVYVILPASLPNILVGLRIGMGLAWVAIVASELIGTNSGLGFAIEWYRSLIMTNKVIGVIIVIGVLGYLSDLCIRKLQEKLTPWSLDAGGE